MRVLPATVSGNVDESKLAKIGEYLFGYLFGLASTNWSGCMATIG